MEPSLPVAKSGQMKEMYGGPYEALLELYPRQAQTTSCCRLLKFSAFCMAPSHGKANKYVAPVEASASVPTPPADVADQSGLEWLSLARVSASSKMRSSGQLRATAKMWHLT